MAQSSSVASVGVAFALLEVIASQGPGGADITTICREAGLSRRTAYRHLATLRELRVVEPASGEFGLYRLGPALEEWAARSSRQREFMVQSIRQVDAVAERTGAVVHCTIYDQGSVLTVAAARGDNGGRHAAAVGTRRPAHATASGKVFLAHSSTALEAYLTRPLAAVTDRTITTPEQLQVAVHRTRELGYGCDEHEFVHGVCCVAVPVWGQRAVVGALSVSLPWRQDEPFRAAPALLRPLRQAAQKFTLAIGGKTR